MHVKKEAEKELSFAEMFDLASERAKRERRYVVWYKMGVYRSFLQGTDGGPLMLTLEDALRMMRNLQAAGGFCWVKRRES